jgi:site-specific DNA recombinase
MRSCRTYAADTTNSDTTPSPAAGSRRSSPNSPSRSEPGLHREESVPVSPTAPLGELTFRENTVTDTHEPIITADTWTEAEALRYYTCFTRARYDTATCDAPRLNADAVDAAVLDALAGFYRNHRDLIADAVDQAQREHRAAHGDRKAELDGIAAELARTQQATDRYLLAFERGTLDEGLVAERLTALKTTRQQLSARRHELTAALDDEPTAPDPTLLDQVADHLAEIINTGTPNQRKALVEALVERVIITGPDRLVPVFRIPQPAHENGAATAQPAETAPNGAVRTMTKLVELRGFEPLTP